MKLTDIIIIKFYNYIKNKLIKISKEHNLDETELLKLYIPEKYHYL